MLFRKKIQRSCSYCKHAAKMDDAHFLCTKKGIIDGAKSCRKFDYDPCKRVPPKAKAMDFSQYSTEEFTL